VPEEELPGDFLAIDLLFLRRFLSEKIGLGHLAIDFRRFYQRRLPGY
jgi:hypothetical protein